MEWETDARPYNPPGAPDISRGVVLAERLARQGPCINLLLPQCELQIVLPGPTPDSVMPFLNRPTKNMSAKYWLRVACKDATALGAALGFACDTPEQVKWAVRHAGRLLPAHERIPLERMSRPETRRPAVKLQ